MALHVLAPLVATLPLADSPALVHTEGASISRVWEISSVTTTDSEMLDLMGNEQDLGAGRERTSSRTVEVTDEFKKVADGRATAFHRLHDTAEVDNQFSGGTTGDNVEVQMFSGSSELEQTGVEFVLEDGEWTKSWDEDSSGEDAWLDDLVADMDLQSLLPTNDDGEPIEVSEGDRWELDGSLLNAIIAPGGEVQVEPAVDEDHGEGGIHISIPGASSNQHWDELDGDVNATWAKLVERDGKRFAQIVVEVDLAGEVDIVEALEEDADERGSNDAFETAILEREVSGEITVLWDLEANRPHSLEAELECSEAMTVDWIIAADSMELDLSYASESTIVYDITGAWSSGD